ncbi:hypothetical protein PAT3040_02646, partial [Paenibacillus agaridevorans]
YKTEDLEIDGTNPLNCSGWGHPANKAGFPL